MKFKRLIAAITIQTSSLLGTPKFQQPQAILQTQHQLTETLTAPAPTKTAETTQNTAEPLKNQRNIITITTDDLKQTPFDPQNPMPGVTITATNLLGKTQAHTILSKYNQHSSDQDTFQKKLESGIHIPLIYPELKDTFPATLDALIRTPIFQQIIKKENYSFESNHIILIIKTKHEKNALAYYQNGELAMATFTSLGTAKHKTIKGQFSLRHDKIFRTSRKYKAPMPYAIQIKNGYFLHQGTSDGKPRSHGCIRVPGLYQKWLYEQLKNKNAEIIIHAPYTITKF